jgi:hypothetical protein
VLPPAFLHFQQSVVFVVGDGHNKLTDVNGDRTGTFPESVTSEIRPKPKSVRSVARKCRIEKESGQLSTTQVAAMKTDFKK